MPFFLKRKAKNRFSLTCKRVKNNYFASEAKRNFFLLAPSSSPGDAFNMYISVHQHFKLYCSYVINQYNIIPAVIKKNRCRQDTGIHYSPCKVKHNLTYSSKNWVFFFSSGLAPSRPMTAFHQIITQAIS